ncbi:MAG: Gx transporter family protein [Ruminococcaceae bacterium]|nr:Gx transporter family protein [Oscillospiraceae bacterium]
MDTRKITRIAMLTAVALVIFVVENQIPVPIPVPGVKLGLANAVTLFAMWTLGRREAGAVLFLRIILGSLVCGTISAMLYSISGAVLCYIAMCFVMQILTMKQMWIMSIIGAVFHNIGQMLAAVLITSTTALIAYLPVLMVSAVITGLFTGLCAQYAAAHYKKIKGDRS